MFQNGVYDFTMRLRVTLAICRGPPVGLSSVCNSVTFVHPTQATEIFGNIFTPFGTLDIY